MRDRNTLKSTRIDEYLWPLRRKPQNEYRGLSALDRVRLEIKRVSERGYIRNTRPKDVDGGVGRTLEDALMIKENNLPIADLEIGEIKGRRKKTTSLQTLFTQTPNIGPFDMRAVLRTCGYPSGAYAFCLNSTVRASSPNSQDLRLEVMPDRIAVLFKGKEICGWKSQTIEKRLDKIRNVIWTIADSKKIAGVEYFHYVEAYFLKSIDREKFADLIQRDAVLVDFRMHTRAGRSDRDHGTAFRIKPQHFEEMYGEVERLL